MGYRKSLRKESKKAFGAMGKLGETGAGLSPWQQTQAEYRPQIESSYQQLGQVAGGMGSYEDPAMAQARATQQSFLGGQDFGAGLDSYTRQMMDYANKEVLPQATFGRIGRGSGMQNVAGRALGTQLGNILGQGANLASQRMGIAGQMSQFIPQQQLMEQQARAGTLGQLAEGQRGYAGEMQNLGAMNQQMANAIRNQEFQNKVGAYGNITGQGPINSGFGATMAGIGDLLGGAGQAVAGIRR